MSLIYNSLLVYFSQMSLITKGMYLFDNPNKINHILHTITCTYLIIDDDDSSLT